MESLLLTIEEIEGNLTAISHHTSVKSGPVTTLREKVFCVLGPNQPQQIYSPVHTQHFNSRHLSMLTLQIRAYSRKTNTYVPYWDQPKIGLWFKLYTDDCVNNTPEYVYCVYNSDVDHNRYDLGFRKSINAIELTHYQILGKKFKTHITSFDLYDPASEWSFDSGLVYGSDTPGGYTPNRGGYKPGTTSPLYPFEFTPIFTGPGDAIISVEGLNIHGNPVDVDALVTFKTNDVESENRLQGVIDISANGNTGYVVFKFLITVDGQTSRPQYLATGWQ
jgi:hypothetical protein